MFKFKKAKNVDQLIIALIPQLRSYARSLAFDKDRADDLVQDCLQRAFEKIHQWQTGTNLRAWLFTIMHNIYVSHLRRMTNGPQFTQFDYSDDYYETNNAGESTQKIASDMRDLESALKTLSSEHREVIHLVCIEELSYEEVANILGIAKGTVMSRLARAREQLRLFINNDSGSNLRRIK